MGVLLKQSEEETWKRCYLSQDRGRHLQSGRGRSTCKGTEAGVINGNWGTAQRAAAVEP